MSFILMSKIWNELQLGFHMLDRDSVYVKLE